MLEEAAKFQILAGVAGKVTRYAAEGLKVSKKNWENKKFVIVGGLFERVWEYYK